jgi:hypothetical protein
MGRLPTFSQSFIHRIKGNHKMNAYSSRLVVSALFAAAILLLAMFTYFVLPSAVLSSTPNIRSNIIQFSAFLIIFLGFMFEMHYKVLHGLAVKGTRTQIKKHYPSNNLHINATFALICFLIIASLLSMVSSVISNFSSLLLSFSISLIVVTAVSIPYLLFKVMTGKLEEIENSYKG